MVEQKATLTQQKAAPKPAEKTRMAATSAQQRRSSGIPGFVTFVFFTFRCHLFFILRCHLFSSQTHALSHTIFHFSYLMKPLGETLLILLPVVLQSVVL